MAFVSCTEIAVHYTHLHRQPPGHIRAAWMPHALAYASCRQRHESDSTQKWDDLLTPRSLQFFNSPNIHTCTWISPIHSTNSLWFCPLEVEFVISCPALMNLIMHCTRLRETNRSAECVMGWLTMWKANCFLFLCEVVIVLQKYWKRNWTNDCCF